MKIHFSFSNLRLHLGLVLDAAYGNVSRSFNSLVSPCRMAYTGEVICDSVLFNGNSSSLIRRSSADLEINSPAPACRRSDSVRNDSRNHECEKNKTAARIDPLF